MSMRATAMEAAGEVTWLGQGAQGAVGVVAKAEVAEARAPGSSGVDIVFEPKVLEKTWRDARVVQAYEREYVITFCA